MSACAHHELLEILELINDSTRTKEFICEDCLSIFSSCPLDEKVPKTAFHLESCNHCNSKKKPGKFKGASETWQKQLAEFGYKKLDDKRKKRA